MAQEQPRRSRVTLAEVAERAGVSRSAAGFVLSGRRDQRIATQTWQRVERAAAELGYRPNLTARTLRTGLSGTVAMISDHISTTSLANAMISGAVRALGERGVVRPAMRIRQRGTNGRGRPFYGRGDSNRRGGDIDVAGFARIQPGAQTAPVNLNDEGLDAVVSELLRVQLR